jgi:hypothetical protein
LPFPDFLVIGAQKAGTSWLHENLSRHPEIWTPPLKELHYFDERVKEPAFGALVARLLGKEYTDVDWYPWYWRYQLKERVQRHRKNFDLQALLWDFKFFVRSPSDGWYASLFEQGRGKVSGEFTPEYSRLGDGIVAHIHELMPNTKVIFFMRNPIERVYSAAAKHLKDRRSMGQHGDATTDEQLNPGPIVPGLRDIPRVRDPRYLQTIERWRRSYPDEQIFIGFLEDIHFYPHKLLRRLYGFLRVDPSYARHAIRSRINPGHQKTMPTRMAAHLARNYLEDLQLLSARFGGYAYFWLYCAERLANDTPSVHAIPYPLWDSWLWGEWLKQSRSFTQLNLKDGEVQSRSLA